MKKRAGRPWNWRISMERPAHLTIGILCGLLLWQPFRLGAQALDRNLAERNRKAIERLLRNVHGDEETVTIDDMVFRVSDLQKAAELASGISGRLWPDGHIFYQFDSTITESLQNSFKIAAEEWERVAPVKFFERTTENDYIRIKLDDGNYSFVGMRGGEQTMGLTANAGPITILHELGHALILQHEHQRSDRDNYVTILTQNIQVSQLHNFDLITDTINPTPYDFLSIMHYDKRAFSANGKNTIEPKPQYAQYIDIMGRTGRLSDLDIKAVRLLYSMAPIPMAPEEGATGVPPDNAKISWSTVSGAEQYVYQLSRDTLFTFPQPADTIIAAHHPFDAVRIQTIKLPRIASLTTYVWRVRALRTSGPGPWSQIRQFSTTLAAPAEVMLQSPEAGAVLPNGAVTLTWQPDPDSEVYEVQVALDTLFSRLVLENTAVFAARLKIETLPPNQTYYWRVRGKNAVGAGRWSEVRNFHISVASAVIQEQGEAPAEFALFQNYPNPFNPGTTIPFDLPEAGSVKLQIFNLLGQEVARLVDGRLAAGSYTITWSADNLRAGAYFYRLKANSRIAVKKLLLVK